VLFLLAILSTSYAVLSVKLVGERKYSLTIGTLDFKLDNEKNAIRLMNAYPMSDEEGQGLTPYTFSLTNTGTLKEHYKISLVTDTKQQESCTGCEFLTPAKLRYSLNINGIVGTSKTLSEITTLDSGELAANETKNYELRLWLRSDATIEEENKYYFGKIKVDTSQEDVQEEIVIAGHQFSVEKSTDTFPDLKQPSSETNGRGIYKYTEDGEDVYYFRGAVENNHVIFAGYCWEMVRTTKTGGVKMIYDGTPVTIDGKQTCSNTGEASQLAEKTRFNAKSNSPAYNGYMYGNNTYDYTETTSEQESGTYLYGNDVVWNETTKKYTLVSTITSTGVWETDYSNIANAHHYTCFNSTGECEEVYYIFATTSNLGNYIILNDGKYIDNAWEEMHKNEQDSTIKQNIEIWFENTSLIQEENFIKLEDTVYCNDRSVNRWAGWDKNGNSNDFLQYTTAHNTSRDIPILECKKRPNNIDAFTYKDKINGNGMLKYPVGLLTEDEFKLAGSPWNKKSDNYLLSNTEIWLMTPSCFYHSDTALSHASSMWIDKYLNVGNTSVVVHNAIRPVIALKSDTKFASGGDGSEGAPFIIE